jgi:hypothetical protein
VGTALLSRLGYWAIVVAVAVARELVRAAA